MQSPPMTAAMISGPRQPSKAEGIHVGIQSAEKEPSRAMVRLIPNAKPSSRPLNHLARAQVMATISGSDPRPRRNRATTMTQ